MMRTNALTLARHVALLAIALSTFYSRCCGCPMELNLSGESFWGGVPLTTEFPWAERTVLYESLLVLTGWSAKTQNTDLLARLYE